MAFVGKLSDRYDESHPSAVVIEGRPDFRDPRFGVTVAKKHPPYVFSLGNGSCLVHKVARVDLHWWKVIRGGSAIGRVSRPLVIAHTICNQSKFLRSERARTCQIPAADAILCGVCHGEPATFGKHGSAKKNGLTRREAGVKLGCAVRGY